ADARGVRPRGDARRIPPTTSPRSGRRALVRRRCELLQRSARRRGTCHRSSHDRRAGRWLVRRLVPPQVSAHHALTRCIESIRDKDLTGRLTQVMPTIMDGEETYDAHGQASTLYLIPGTDGID